MLLKKLLLTLVAFATVSLVASCGDSVKVVGTVPYVDPSTVCNVCDAIGEFERWAWETYGVKATLEVGPADSGAVDIYWDDAAFTAAPNFNWDAYCAYDCWIVGYIGAHPVIKCRSECYPWPTPTNE